MTTEPKYMNYEDPEIRLIAAMAHEINRAYCQAIGDNSQVDWEAAPVWQKESAIAGVKFHKANPNAGPEASHENWLAHKIADGWTYGPEKDPDNKRHPCCLPFSELDPKQQIKDVLFKALVNAFETHYPLHFPPRPDAVGVVPLETLG